MQPKLHSGIQLPRAIWSLGIGRNEHILTNIPTGWYVSEYDGHSSSGTLPDPNTVRSEGREHEYTPDHHADRVLRRRHRLGLAEHRHLHAPARHMAPPALA